MKKGSVLFLFGLILGVGLTLMLTFVVISKKMFVVMESKYSFSETIEHLEESVAENKWSIPHRYDLRATLEGKSLKVDSVNVFSLCNPKFAYEILNSDDNRLVSAIMPCRVSVYEKDGKTYISMLNSDLFARFLGKEVKDVLETASSENLKILEPLVE